MTGTSQLHSDIISLNDIIKIYYRKGKEHVCIVLYEYIMFNTDVSVTI